MTEQCVILNDIHIDIMDYIKPAYCTEAQVRVLVSWSLEPCSLFLSSEVCGPNSSGRTG